MTSHNDQVQLIIPASAEYAMVARLAVAGIATRLGLTYDHVEDLRVIVAEICRLLLGGDSNGSGSLTLTYSVGRGELAIEGTADRSRTPIAPEEDDLSISLLEALTDGFEVETSGDAPRVRVVKRLPA